jgi:hypothetical protein
MSSRFLLPNSAMLPPPGNLGTMLCYEVRNLIGLRVLLEQAPEMRGHKECPGMTPVLKGITPYLAPDSEVATRERIHLFHRCGTVPSVKTNLELPFGLNDQLHMLGVSI